MSRCDDYCCNHGCNQGRDCPTRVARVGGYRTQSKDALPPTTWRRYLHHLAGWMLITIVMMLLAAAFVGAVAC